jgi:lysophospholipid acyltransferase (LPLAT)-like uncharacterized protein
MFKQFKYFVLLRVAPPIIWGFINLLKLTLRITYGGSQEFKEALRAGKQYIFCFWHGRLLLMPFAAPPRGVKVLISRHRDGEFITRVVSYFGLGAVRGSHRKGGVGSARQLMRELVSGSSIAITPDGPKGPRQVFKDGIVELAQMTGIPIVLLTYGAGKKKLFTPGTDSSCPTLSQGSFSYPANPF